MRDLRDLRLAHGGHEPEPLSVHPILERDGLDGGYAAELAQINETAYTLSWLATELAR